MALLLEAAVHRERQRGLPSGYRPLLKTLKWLKREALGGPINRAWPLARIRSRDARPPRRLRPAHRRLRRVRDRGRHRARRNGPHRRPLLRAAGVRRAGLPRAGAGAPRRPARVDADRRRARRLGRRRHRLDALPRRPRRAAVPVAVRRRLARAVPVQLRRPPAPAALPPPLAARRAVARRRDRRARARARSSWPSCSSPCSRAPSRAAAPPSRRTSPIPSATCCCLVVVIWAFASTGVAARPPVAAAGRGHARLGRRRHPLPRLGRPRHLRGGRRSSTCCGRGPSLLMGWAAWQPRQRGALRLGGLRVVLVPVVFARAGARAAQRSTTSTASATWRSRWPPPRCCLAVVRMGMTFLANARMLRRQPPARGHRRAHRARQPPAADGGPRRGMRPDGGERRAARALRPRRLQALQRHLRPPRRRRAAPAPRLAARSARSAPPAAPTGWAATSSACCCPARRRPDDAFVDAAAAALRESGEGFSIAASYGSVRARRATSRPPPRRCRSPTSACTATSSSARPGAPTTRATCSCGSSTSASPGCTSTSPPSRELASAVGERLGFDRGGARRARPRRRAARHRQDGDPRHDPQQARARSTTTEWAFMRRHTTDRRGDPQRRPGAVPVARIVRSSHERFDGDGYPDALAGDGHPDRRPHRRRLRRLRRDDERPLLPPRDVPRRPRSRSCGAAPARSSTRPSSTRSAPRWTAGSPPSALAR